MKNDSTLEDHVCSKELLAKRLNANQMPITVAKLKKAILGCLPWQFDPHKASLAASTATCGVEQTLSAIKVVAANIGFNDQVPRAPRAAVVRKPAQGAGGGTLGNATSVGRLGTSKRTVPS